MVPSYDELRLILQNIEALKQRTINDLDALAAQVVSFLPKEEGDKAKAFRRYNRDDWESYLETGSRNVKQHRIKAVG
jgi:hypothetical protein